MRKFGRNSIRSLRKGSRYTTPTNIPVISGPSNQSVDEGETATFSVTLVSPLGFPVSYQWYKTGVGAIAGANSASYTTPDLSYTDGNSQYYCIVTNFYGSTSSRYAGLSVNDITDPSPGVISVSIIDDSTLRIALDTSPSDANSGVASIALQRSLTTGAGFSTIGTGLTYPYSDTGLDSSTDYYYRLFVTDESGNTALSAEVSETTATSGDTQTPVVTGFTVDNATDTLTANVSLFTATDDVGVTDYQITTINSAPAAGGGGWTAITPTTSMSETTTVTLPGYGVSQTYYGWVKDAAGNVSLPLSDTSIATDETAPAIPTGFSVGSETSSSITITFTAGTDAGSGILRHDLVESSDDVTVVRSNVSSGQVIGGLPASTSFSWKIKAIDVAGNSSVSALAATSTLAASGVNILLQENFNTGQYVNTDSADVFSSITPANGVFTGVSASLDASNLSLTLHPIGGDGIYGNGWNGSRSFYFYRTCPTVDEEFANGQGGMISVSSPLTTETEYYAQWRMRFTTPFQALGQIKCFGLPSVISGTRALCHIDSASFVWTDAGYIPATDYADGYISGDIPTYNAAFAGMAFGDSIGVPCSIAPFPTSVWVHVQVHFLAASGGNPGKLEIWLNNNDEADPSGTVSDNSITVDPQLYSELFFAGGNFNKDSNPGAPDREFVFDDFQITDGFVTDWFPDTEYNDISGIRWIPRFDGSLQPALETDSATTAAYSLGVGGSITLLDTGGYSTPTCFKKTILAGDTSITEGYLQHNFGQNNGADFNDPSAQTFDPHEKDILFDMYVKYESSKDADVLNWPDRSLKLITINTGYEGSKWRHNQIYLYIDPAGQYQLDCPEWQSVGGGPFVGQLVTAVAARPLISNGTYDHVRIRAKLNDEGVSNGIVSCWINDVLIFNDNAFQWTGHTDNESWNRLIPGTISTTVWQEVDVDASFTFSDIRLYVPASNHRGYYNIGAGQVRL